eukprot:3026054-Alexandrium_andersonii.AAC.1
MPHLGGCSPGRARRQRPYKRQRTRPKYGRKWSPGVGPASKQSDQRNSARRQLVGPAVAQRTRQPVAQNPHGRRGGGRRQPEAGNRA